MDRDLLAHLPIVVAVARCGGFAAAAATLNMSPSAVSHAVRAVEDRLGQPLFARTTRSVALTEAGERIIGAIGPALDAISDAVEALAADQGVVTGLLKINAPRIALEMGVTPILAKLAWQHPRLTVEVQSNDGYVDIVAEGVDAGVRLGDAVQQDMITVRLTKPFKAILVVSPAYIDAKGTPKTIGDLHQHNCIGFRLISTGGRYDWELNDRGKLVSVKVAGTAMVTDPTYVRELALAGAGIGYIYEPLVRREIREGKLKWLLASAAIEEDGLFLYYPKRASMAPKLRAFIDTARALAPK
jgi:DNA-binding transcriptional LysR family regulator